MAAALIIVFDSSEGIPSGLTGAVTDAREAGLDPVVVIGHEELLAAMPPDVWLLEDESEGNEPLSAVQAALDLLDRERVCSSVVLIDAEHGATSEHVRSLEDLARTSPVVVTKYRYARGLPMVLDVSVWPAVMALEETPLLAWVDSHPQHVAESWVASLRDDTATL